MTDADRPGSGHNRGPLDRAEELVANANRWGAERPAIDSEEIAGKGQEFVDQLLTTRAALEAERDAEVEPYDALIDAIKLRYKDSIALINLAIDRMREKLGAWLSVKRRRLDEEQAQREQEAERLKAEANAKITEAAQTGTLEAHLASEKATRAALDADKDAKRGPERAQIKGDHSSKAMSFRTTWAARSIDDTLAIRSYAKRPEVRAAALAAALKLANKDAREKKSAKAAPPGFEFYPKETAV